MSPFTLWDSATGACRHTLCSHTGGVLGCPLTADGRVARAASLDCTLKVWDTTTGVDIHTLPGHTSEGWGCALSADGRLARSAAADMTLKLWDTASGALLATFPGAGSLACCALSADGRTVLAGDRLGRLDFLRVEGLAG